MNTHRQKGTGFVGIARADDLKQDNGCQDLAAAYDGRMDGPLARGRLRLRGASVGLLHGAQGLGSVAIRRAGGGQVLDHASIGVKSIASEKVIALLTVKPILQGVVSAHPREPGDLRVSAARTCGWVLSAGICGHRSACLPRLAIGRVDRIDE